MSAALARLRTLFNAPLFRRSAQGLVPTPKARELAEPVSQALQQIKAALLPKEQFEPATSAMTFTVGRSEYPAFVLLPLLTRALEKLGPARPLSVHAIGSRDSAVEVVLDDVVEVFDLAPQDRYVAAGGNRMDRRLVGAALVHRDLVRIAVALMALSKKRVAAAMSRLAVSRKSTVLPCLSTAR